jgi:hypothetical protein
MAAVTCRKAKSSGRRRLWAARSEVVPCTGCCGPGCRPFPRGHHRGLAKRGSLSVSILGREGLNLLEHIVTGQRPEKLDSRSSRYPTKRAEWERPVNLSACLAKSGRRVLVVDLDSQANCTSHFGIDPETTSSLSSHGSIQIKSGLRALWIGCSGPRRLAGTSARIRGTFFESLRAFHSSLEFRLLGA